MIVRCAKWTIRAALAVTDNLPAAGQSFEGSPQPLPCTGCLCLGVSEFQCFVFLLLTLYSICRICVCIAGLQHPQPLQSPITKHIAMTDKTIPAPGPAKLKRNAGPDEWLEAAKNCKYLSEHHMKQLCDIVKEFMMEGLYRVLPFSFESRRSFRQNRTYNQFLRLSRYVVIYTGNFTIYWSSSE